MNRGQLPTNQLYNINWGALDHASRAPQLSCNYVCVHVCVFVCTSCVCVRACVCMHTCVYVYIVCVRACVCAYMHVCVGSCLETEVFMSNLPATEREWVISNSYRVTVCSVRVYLLYLFHAAFGKLSCKFMLLHGRKPCSSTVLASSLLCLDHLRAVLISVQEGQGRAHCSSTHYTAFAHSHSDPGRTECSRASPGSFCSCNPSPKTQ